MPILNKSNTLTAMATPEVSRHARGWVSGAGGCNVDVAPALFHRSLERAGSGRHAASHGGGTGARCSATGWYRPFSRAAR